MKQLFTLCLLAFALGARAQAVMQFDTDDHDFGKVAEGTMATHEFRFKNTGNQPVVIANVQASCGCTTPTGPKRRCCPASRASSRPCTAARAAPACSPKP